MFQMIRILRLSTDEKLDISDMTYPMLSSKARQMLFKIQYVERGELWKENQEDFYHER